VFCARVITASAPAVAGSTEPMGGIACMLAGHLFQLPPVQSGGTWFADLLRVARQDRGDIVGKGTDRLTKQRRNIAAGLHVLRQARRFDLTYNFRAQSDPAFAAALDTLCDVDHEGSLGGFLDTIKLYDATERDYRFGQPFPSLSTVAHYAALYSRHCRFAGPFVVLSNVERDEINHMKLLEYAKLHRLPVVRWKWPVAGLDIDDELYEHEHSLWGYFVEGAPVQLNVTFNSSRGAANGSPAVLHSLQFNKPDATVERAMARSGRYDGPAIDISFSDVVRVLLRVSGADWHGLPMQKLGHVIPEIASPVGGDLVTGVIALPFFDPAGQKAGVAFTSMHAAINGFKSTKMKKPTYDLAFALTDYKIQGMTRTRLVFVAGVPLSPLRHSRSSLYVVLSRVQLGAQNRLLLLDPQARALLERVRHRDELLVFDKAYNKDGLFCVQLALRAYDRLQSRDNGDGPGGCLATPLAASRRRTAPARGANAVGDLCDDQPVLPSPARGEAKATGARRTKRRLFFGHS
jgi:hypothetical protein